MRRITSSLIILSSLCGTAWGQVALPTSQPARRTGSMTADARTALRTEEPKIKDRFKRIGEEIEKLDPKALKDGDWAKEWAGRYYEGDGLGTNVSIAIAPKSGVAFLNYGCTGLYGGDHGEIVESTPDGLTLKLVFGSAKNSYLSERIYFVRWGEERFLVPDWKLLELVNNFNRGGYACTSMHGIPRLTPPGESGHRPIDPIPDGKPELPPQFSKLLLASPVDLIVKNVTLKPVPPGKQIVESLDGTLEFEGGSAKGVFVGMEFDVPRGDNEDFGTIRITRVDTGTSSAEFDVFAGRNKSPRPPKVGDRIPTGEPRRTPSNGEAVK